MCTHVYIAHYYEKNFEYHNLFEGFVSNLVNCSYSWFIYQAEIEKQRFKSKFLGVITKYLNSTLNATNLNAYLKIAKKPFNFQKLQFQFWQFDKILTKTFFQVLEGQKYILRNTSNISYTKFSKWSKRHLAHLEAESNNNNKKFKVENLKGALEICKTKAEAYITFI